MAKIKLRLSFAEMNEPDISFWENILLKNGVEILSARKSGIDAEGEVRDIERALKTKLRSINDRPPSFGQVGVTEGPGRPVPLAYIPREPSLF